MNQTPNKVQDQCYIHDKWLADLKKKIKELEDQIKALEKENGSRDILYTKLVQQLEFQNKLLELHMINEEGAYKETNAVLQEIKNNQKNIYYELQTEKMENANFRSSMKVWLKVGGTISVFVLGILATYFEMNMEQTQESLNKINERPQYKYEETNVVIPKEEWDKLKQYLKGER